MPSRAVTTDPGRTQQRLTPALQPPGDELAAPFAYLHSRPGSPDTKTRMLGYRVDRSSGDDVALGQAVLGPNSIQNVDSAPIVPQKCPFHVHRLSCYPLCQDLSPYRVSTGSPPARVAVSPIRPGWFPARGAWQCPGRRARPSGRGRLCSGRCGASRGSS